LGPLIALFITIGYGLLKLAAYSAWCFVGLKSMTGQRPASWRKPLFFGFIRMLMGLFFGVGIFLMSAYVYTSDALKDNPYAQPLTYIAVYVPIRWVEWSILNVIMIPNTSLLSLIVGENSQARKFRGGGILVSCLADVPWMICAGGIPVGRFLC